MNIGPLYLFEKTNTPNSILVASWHWRWSHTWRWILWYYLPEGWKFHRMWFRLPRGLMASITTPAGKLHFKSQQNLKIQPPEIHLQADKDLDTETAKSLGNMVEAAVKAMRAGRL